MTQVRTQRQANFGLPHTNVFTVLLQGYVMCVQDYEFHILSNAFLIHRPGVKMKAGPNAQGKLVDEQNRLVLDNILPQLTKIYGTKKGCVWSI
jgi:hypothetical protein